MKPLARKKVKCSPTSWIHPAIWNGFGDHAEALINLTDYLQRKNVEFSEAALQELADIYQKTTGFIKDALDSVENNDIEKAQSLIERHKEINNMERVLRKTHIKTPQQGRSVQHKLGSTLSTSFPLYSCIWPRHEPCWKGHRWTNLRTKKLSWMGWLFSFPNQELLFYHIKNALIHNGIKAF